MEGEIRAGDGARIWLETFGRRTDPAILLIMGGSAQGIVWPDVLCEILAAEGHFVIRYDHRDTGLSSTSDHEYDLSLLASDAAAVVEGLGLERAHVIGQSVGGMAAQLLALDRPHLVLSLGLLSSSPDANGDVLTPPRTGLPGPRAPFLDRVARLTASPPRGTDAVFQSAVEGWRVLLGPSVPFDRPYWEDLVRRTAHRSPGPDTSGRHLAALDATAPLTDRIRALTVPSLVVHGERDPVFPFEHARALHRALPNSGLRQIAGMGHLFPPHWSREIAGLILDHVRRASLVRRFGEAA